MNWISVKDRFPERAGSYLIWRDEKIKLVGGFFQIGFFDGEKWDEQYGIPEGLAEDYIITHWIKITAPKDNE